MDTRTSELARLGVVDYGTDELGRGQETSADGDETERRPILLLHGLMGRGRAWGPHIGWLRSYGHVYTLDAAWHRGRDWQDGRTGLPGPADEALRTERFVADAAAALDAIGGGPAIVIGHSMGGLHAWCLAAHRPDLVRAIVVEDMAPDFSGWTTRPWDAWFDSWPVEFSRAQALDMFGSVAGGYFLDSFDRTDTGWRLHGHISVWQDIAQHWGTRDYWDEWLQVRVPALLIEAEHTVAPDGQMREMAQAARHSGGRRTASAERAVTRYVRVAGAGHLVQADAPDEYRGAVEAFLAELPS